MAIGDQLQRVTLDTPNDSGGFTALVPDEWYAAVRTEGPGQVTLLGHYHPGISTSTRVHFKGRVYHVTSLDNRDERDVQLVVHATEVFD